MIRLNPSRPKAAEGQSAFYWRCTAHSLSQSLNRFAKAPPEQRCLADEPTRNVSLLCRSGLGSKIDTQGFSALIYQLCGQ